MTAVIARDRLGLDGIWEAGEQAKRNRLVDLQGGSFDLCPNVLPVQRLMKLRKRADAEECEWTTEMQGRGGGEAQLSYLKMVVQKHSPFTADRLNFDKEIFSTSKSEGAMQTVKLSATWLGVDEVAELIRCGIETKPNISFVDRECNLWTCNCFLSRKRS